MKYCWGKSFIQARYLLPADSIQNVYQYIMYRSWEIMWNACIGKSVIIIFNLFHPPENVLPFISISEAVPALIFLLICLSFSIILE